MTDKDAADLSFSGLSVNKDLKAIVQNPNLIVSPSIGHIEKRVLRKRELKSYAETPDVIILGPKSLNEDLEVEAKLDAPIIPVSCNC